MSSDDASPGPGRTRAAAPVRTQDPGTGEGGRHGPGGTRSDQWIEDVREIRADEMAGAAHLPARQAVVAAERERFGGVKVGAAFFGWLTATGTAVLLTALLVAAGTAVGLTADAPPSDAVTDAVTDVASDPATVGTAGAVALGLVAFVAYSCGGYVAGRMARFDGARQGLAVWLWALLVAGALALLGAVAGDELNVLEQLDGLPRIPVGEGGLTTAGLVALGVVAATSLLGAVVGGLAGMRYHRRVDRAGFGE